MDYDDAKEYLKHYRELNSQLATVSSLIEDIRSPSLDVRTVNSHRSINDYLDEKYRIEAQMSEIENHVAMIPDGNEQLTIRLRFLEFRSLEQVSAIMCYSLRQVNRFYSNGIRTLAGILSEEEKI